MSSSSLIMFFQLGEVVVILSALIALPDGWHNGKCSKSLMYMFALKEGSSVDIQLFSYGLHILIAKASSLIVRKLSSDSVKH